MIIKYFKSTSAPNSITNAGFPQLKIVHHLTMK
jgi:hypothetical protein